jgi:integrase
MGVVIRQREGAWWVFIHHQGRRKAKRVGTGPSGKKAAEHAAAQFQAQLTLGDTSIFEASQQPEVLTFAHYAAAWLARCRTSALKLGTVDLYSRVVQRHWLPSLGHLEIAAITREHITAIVTRKLGEGIKPITMKSMLNVLHACFHAAVDDGVLAASPAARVGRLVARAGPQGVVPVFSQQELRVLLSVAEREMPACYPLVLTLARTGLRLGEALTLQWADLDFGRRELWVRRTWGSRRKALGDLRINAPKSGKPRRVDMSGQLCAVLQRWHLGQADAALWVFPRRDGPPMLPGAFWQNYWQRLMKRSGLPYRKPHALRHTYASLLLQNGESLAYIRDQLGHHSIKMTVDVYGHLVPGANKRAVDKLDDATPAQPRRERGRRGRRDAPIQPKDESKTFIREWVPGTNIADYLISATIEAVKP